ncbi:hypothetical protein U6G28_08470 [Actinomycetaceae bacterium MB13-C1-2]|nr:hypothetical protein U6G28_08470 [Actinomycetaceae bacterium MB13-C1-2]
MSEEAVDVVLYSADKDRRRAVIEGVGIKAGKGAPPINWIETATAAGTIAQVKDRVPPVVVLDADAPKVGGMAVARDIINELEQEPVIVLLTARPQDKWLATWSGASFTVLAPYAPIDLQETMVKALDLVR